jgi:hypothetical protein
VKLLAVKEAISQEEPNQELEAVIGQSETINAELRLVQDALLE